MVICTKHFICGQLPNPGRHFALPMESERQEELKQLQSPRKNWAGRQLNMLLLEPNGFFFLSKAMCLEVIMENFHQPKSKTFCLAPYTSKVTKSLSGSLIRTVNVITF